MKTYQFNLFRSLAAFLALVLLFVTNPASVYAADDEQLPGLNVLRPQMDPATNAGSTQSNSDTSGSQNTTTEISAENNTSSEKTGVNQEDKSYILGPGDVLTITDYSLKGDADFIPQTVTILPDGTVNVYPMGLLKPSGLTVKQFNELLNEKAAEYVVEPQYVVSILQQRPLSVYVLGEVANPGLYNFGNLSGSVDSSSGMGEGMGMPTFGGRRLGTKRPTGPAPPGSAARMGAELAGAYMGAKFAGWAPKWGGVGLLAATSGGLGQKAPAQAPGLAASANFGSGDPLFVPGTGMPSRSLGMMGGQGNASMNNNFGSLTVGQAVGGVSYGGGSGYGGTSRGGASRYGFGSSSYGGGGGYGYSGAGGSEGLLLPAQASVTINNVTVMSAIERAGGLRETANVRRIQIRRADSKEVTSIDLWRLISEGDISQDVALQPGDTVFVPQGGSDFNPDALGALAAFQGRWVRVLGAVRAPGLVELRPNDDVYSVVARAGGFNDTAATRSVAISRMNRDGTVFSKRISLPKGLKDREALARLPVQSGDVVMVSTSLVKTAGVTILKAGMVTALAMLVIYFSNKVHNVNVQTNDEGTPTNNARVAVF